MSYLNNPGVTELFTSREFTDFATRCACMFRGELNVRGDGIDNTLRRILVESGWTDKRDAASLRRAMDAIERELIWGPYCPIPKQMGDDGPVVELPGVQTCKEGR